MKTIAITIDEDTLSSIDEMLSPKSSPWKSRSQLIREAVQQFLDQKERVRREEHEAAVFQQNREQLAAQALALVSEQAEL